MSKKSSTPEDPGAGQPWLKTALIGAGVLVASAVIAIVLFTAFGGSSSSEGDPEREDLPELGEAPILPRSDAADLLESTSFEDMTQEERDLVKLEAERVWGDAELRASAEIQGVEILIDIVRRAGQTIAYRQYRYGTTANDGVIALYETIVFFCTTSDGGVDAYRADKSPLETTVRYDRQLADEQPYDKEFTSGDWTSPVDLGYDEVHGRRVHGIEVPWGAADIRWQMWFDVETAQMLKRVEISNDPNGSDKEYIFDWRRPPRIEPPPPLEAPPCLDEVYPQG